MRKTFKYRLYPSRVQSLALEGQLTAARHLYNAALQERRDAWHMGHKSLSYYDQANQIKAIREAGDLTLANYSACQDVLRRVDKTFQAFFQRVKRGQKAGYPRFKGHDRYDSLTYPAYGDGCKLLVNGKLRVQSVGHLKVKWHRPLDGNIKTVTIKREGSKWYVCFSTICEPKPLPPSTESVGIDVGLAAFATLSTGESVDNPRYYRTAEGKLRIAQRRVTRRKKGSHGRRKAVTLLRKAHHHIRNQRADFHHKVARSLVDRYGLIVMEALAITSMVRTPKAKPGENGRFLPNGAKAKAGLNLSISDAGWAQFVSFLSYKAEDAGRTVVKVNPNGTSQRCVCGQAVPKDLGDRWHTCPNCGLSVSRDQAAALEILRLGLSLAGPTWASRPCVPAEAVCFG